MIYWTILQWYKLWEQRIIIYEIRKKEEKELTYFFVKITFLWHFVFSHQKNMSILLKNLERITTPQSLTEFILMLPNSIAWLI